MSHRQWMSWINAPHKYSNTSLEVFGGYWVVAAVVWPVSFKALNMIRIMHMPSVVFLARCVSCQMSGRVGAWCCWCSFPLDTLCMSVSHCLCTWLSTTSAVRGEQMSEYIKVPCSKQSAGQGTVGSSLSLPVADHHWCFLPCVWHSWLQSALISSDSACWINGRGS